MKRNADYYRDLMKYSDMKAAPYLCAYRRFFALYQHEKELRELEQEADAGTADDPLGVMRAKGVAPGRVYNMVETNIATLAFADPKVALKGFPTNFDEGGARLYERLANAVMATSESFQISRELAIRDGTLGGLGVTATFLPVPDEDWPEDHAFDDDPMMEDLAGQVEMDTVTQLVQLPPDEVDKDFRALPYGNYSFVHIPLENFVGDPDSVTNDDPRFIGRKFYLDVEVAEAQFPGARFTEDPETVKYPIKQVYLCELYVRKADHTYELVYFQVSGGKWLYRAKNSGLWIDHPYRILKMHKGHGLWGAPEVLPSYGAIKTERVAWQKASDSQFAASDEVILLDDQLELPEEKMFTMKNAPGVRFFRVNQGNGSTRVPVQQLFAQVSRQSRTLENLAFIRSLDAVFQLSSGYGPNQAGQAMKSETSASEANAVAAYSKARATPKVRQADRWMSGWVWDILGLAAQFWKTEDIARIVGLELAAVWTKNRLRKADVQRHLAIQVIPGSMTPVDDQTRMHGAIQALGIVNQDQQLRQLVDVRKFFEVIANALGFPGDSGVFLPTPETIPVAPEGGQGGGMPGTPAGIGNPGQAALGAILGG